MIDSSTIQHGFQTETALQYRDCFRMMPYADTIRIYRLKGEELLDLLKDNALRLFNSEDMEEERGFLQFSRHIRYTIWTSVNRSKVEISDAFFQGVPLEDLRESVFHAASTCFVRELSSSWKSCTESGLIRLHDFPFEDTELLLRREITAYIKEHGGITAAGGVVRDGRLRVIHPESGEE